MAVAYIGLSAIGERVDNEEGLDRLQTLLDDPDRPMHARVDAGFALGRLFDNADRHDHAFQFFARANALYGQLIAGSETRFDSAAFQQQIASLIQTCTPELYSNIELSSPPRESAVIGVEIFDTPGSRRSDCHH